jgi:serine/tyrosine/threonine adenylyltransferase
MDAQSEGELHISVGLTTSPGRAFRQVTKIETMADFSADQPGTPGTQAPGGPSRMPNSPANWVPDFVFDNSYARLPERFFVRLAPAAVAAPRLVVLNNDLAQQLGIAPAALAAQEGVQVLAGNRLPLGAEPLSMAYAGHQFGVWVPLLGDGRAVLIGEVIDRKGVRRDIQLKGAGRTPFSRMGDGRAALGPCLREYILSESMAALGVPTTRALAVVTSGERSWREGFQPGAVLTRVAQSHVRIGTFELFASRGDTEAVRLLAGYVIDRLYPELGSAQHPYRALLDAVIDRTAALMARWQLIGFIHGVMNTDNMAIAGETIDYGPCAFMDAFDPQRVFSSIDINGRYAFGNQPRIAYWNLAQFAEALLPLLDPDPDKAIAAAREALNAFPARFEAAYLAGLRRKLGLLEPKDGDAELAQELFELMSACAADFTLTFRRLSDLVIAGEEAGPFRALFSDTGALDDWLTKWRTRIAQERRPSLERRFVMRAANPAFIPRNHRVQAVITAAQEAADFGPLNELLTVLARPYDDQPEFAHYADPPRPDEVVQKTFCGT